MPTYYEDPSSLTRVVEYEVPADDLQAMKRDYAERVTEEDDSILDWAVGSGRIEMSERDAWEPKLRADPAWGRETLQLLPPNEALAEKAFHEDRRLRSLDHQWLGHLGVETRPVKYEADDDATQEEWMARQLLSVLGK